jgi:carbonic anhydrase/acetyltransferase-like protein (isoleucine patch superfamily)
LILDSQSSKGDVHNVKIGSNSHLQDRVVVHVSRHNAKNLVAPTVVGDNVVIGASASQLNPQHSCAACAGAGAILHACTVQSDAVIGPNAVVFDGAVVEQGAVVAAGAVVPANAVVKSGTVRALGLTRSVPLPCCRLLCVVC